MKHIKILSVLFLSSMLFTSCEEEIMEWEERPEDQRVTTAELPLELEEKISRYDALNTYTDYVLGAGIVMDLYLNNETYRNIVNENFDDVTVGYAMKHGAMVNSQGEINFGPVDEFVAMTNESGLHIYGHTLAWHANQNASYLNGLIAPTVIPGTSGGNILNLSALKDGTFTNWGRNGTINIAAEQGLADGTPALQFDVESPANFYDVQLRTPEINSIIEGHTYEISFYVKSDQSGSGRVTFRGLGNNYPSKDWYGTGATETFSTSSEWKQVKFTVDDFAVVDGEVSPFGIDLNFGYSSNVNYFIDINTLSLVDLDAEAETINLITNGDFDAGTLDPWNGWGNGSTRAVSAEGEGYGNTGYAMVLTNPLEADLYTAQQVFTLSEPLEVGTEYTYSFYVKANKPAQMQVQIQGGSAQYSGPIDVGTTWSQVMRTVTPTEGNNALVFDFGQTATTFYIDDVVLTSGEVATGTDPVIIEMSDEEKAEVIGAALEDWIVGMVTHYKDEVTAWDVVNEPMREGGTLRDGNVTDPADDDFYWVKYLGKDYAVTAFKLAREHANPSDVLFINDYNLESSMAKLDGLIEYVQYIESQGATVDGIGTQMHVSLNTSRENIVQMFQKMAATGKLVKISELDVRLGTADPTAEQLADQADMYQFILDSFREHVPAAQQYGVTLWNISDNENEHEYWLPEESPNVWDANYERKHAYKGVADGLAGRDVSEDFTGELDY